jgi:hypothetical protein
MPTKMGELQTETYRWAPSDSGVKSQRDSEDEKLAPKKRDHNSYPG